MFQFQNFFTELDDYARKKIWGLGKRCLIEFWSKICSDLHQTHSSETTLELKTFDVRQTHQNSKGDSAQIKQLFSFYPQVSLNILAFPATNIAYIHVLTSSNSNGMKKESCVNSLGFIILLH